MGTASAQAGVFSGLNPATFNSGDPIVLFIIQVSYPATIELIDFKLALLHGVPFDNI